MTASANNTAVAGLFSISYQYIKKGTGTNGTSATVLSETGSSQPVDNTLLFVIIAVAVIAFLVTLTVILVCVFRKVKNKKITPKLIEDELKKLKDKENTTTNKENRLEHEQALMMDDYYNKSLI